MKIHKLISILPFLIVFACNTNSENPNEKENIDSLDNLDKDQISTQQNEKFEKPQTESILDNAKSFVKLMYDDQYAVYEFNENTQLRSSHIKHFSDVGLLNIYGLGHNRYKEKSNSSPLQLDIYLFEYKNDSLAKLSRDNIIRPWNISSAKDGLHPDTPKDSLERPVFLNPKSGGFIFQYKNNVISLIKKCRGNNLNNIPWPEYESRFLSKMNINEKIDIIWAKCGHAQFEIKTYDPKMFRE